MIKQILATIVALLCMPVAHAIDSYSVDVGEGNETKLVKIAAQQAWFADSSWLLANNLESYWEVSVADIEERKYQDVEGQHRSFADFGITPVLRYRGASKLGLFVEVGIGAHYFTEQFDNGDNILASKFEFGDHFGIGYLFSNHVEVTMKIQHFSDAGIKEPNSGLNMGIIKIAYPF